MAVIEEEMKSDKKRFRSVVQVEKAYFPVKYLKKMTANEKTKRSKELKKKINSLRSEK